jgi:hypothetical protein
MAEMTDFEKTEIEMAFFRELWQTAAFDVLEEDYRKGQKPIEEFLIALRLDDDSLKNGWALPGSAVRQRDDKKQRPRGPFPHRFEGLLLALLTAEKAYGEAQWDKSKIREKGVFSSPRHIGIHPRDFDLGRITYTGIDAPEHDLYHARTKKEARRKARKQINEVLEDWPERRKQRNAEVLDQYGKWLCQHYINGTSYPAIARGAATTVHAVKNGVRIAAGALNIDCNRRLRQPPS